MATPETAAKISPKIAPELEKEVRFYIKKEVPITRDTIAISDIRGRGLKTGEIPSGKEDLSKPVIVAKQSDGTYQLLDGRHRLDVLEKQGVKNIDAIIGDKTLQPLAQEARKYKSAEEFVNSKEVVYHGGAKNVEDIKPGYFVSKRKEVAEKYIDNPKTETVKELYITKSIKKFKFAPKNITEEFYKNNPNATTLEESNYFSKKGYDGTITAGNLVVYKPELLKTKSQLTDFYNQAVGKVKKSNLGKPKQPPAQAFGAVAGIEPKRDEKGNIVGVGFSPAKALMGVALLSAMSRGKGANLLKEVPTNKSIWEMVYGKQGPPTDAIDKILTGQTKMRPPVGLKTDWRETLGNWYYMRAFKNDPLLSSPDEIASQLGMTENELLEELSNRVFKKYEEKSRREAAGILTRADQWRLNKKSNFGGK